MLKLHVCGQFHIEKKQKEPEPIKSFAYKICFLIHFDGRQERIWYFLCNFVVLDKAVRITVPPYCSFTTEGLTYRLI